MSISDIREFFWPLLEADKTDKHKSSNVINEEDLKITKEEDLKLSYDWAIKFYEGEEKRRSNVEGKSTIFIGTVGFIITILLNITKDLSSSSEPLFFNAFAFSIITIYLSRVVWFAIKVLQRRGYHTISPKSFISASGNFKKNLIVKLVNCTRKNSIVINSKVDYMTMAQEYFKRAIICIALYSCLLPIYYAYSHNVLNWAITSNFIIEFKIQGDSLMVVQLAIGIFIFIFAHLLVFYKNGKLLHPIKTRLIHYVEKNLVWAKISCALAFIFVAYIFYIAILLSLLTIMGIIIANNKELLKLVGFGIIVGSSIIITMKLCNLFKSELILIEKHFRLLADFTAVMIPIIVMYQIYYAPQVQQDSQDFGLILMMLSNKGLLGVPFIVLLVRLIVSFYTLNNVSNDKN